MDLEKNAQDTYNLQGMIPYKHLTQRELTDPLNVKPTMHIAATFSLSVHGRHLIDLKIPVGYDSGILLNCPERERESFTPQSITVNIINHHFWSI